MEKPEIGILRIPCTPFSPGSSRGFPHSGFPNSPLFGGTAQLLPDCSCRKALFAAFFPGAKQKDCCRSLRNLQLPFLIFQYFFSILFCKRHKAADASLYSLACSFSLILLRISPPSSALPLAPAPWAQPLSLAEPLRSFGVPPRCSRPSCQWQPHPVLPGRIPSSPRGPCR